MLRCPECEKARQLKQAQYKLEREEGLKNPVYDSLRAAANGNALPVDVTITHGMTAVCTAEPLSRGRFRKRKTVAG